jgi:LPXTG-site transpeptidase (sortase) family protein
MSTSAFTPSFGLGYLNEQQRFVREQKPKPVTKPQASIVDISGLTKGRLGVLDTPAVAHTEPELPKVAPVETAQTIEEADVSEEEVRVGSFKAAMHFASGLMGEIAQAHWFKRFRSHKVLPVIAASVAPVSGLVIFGLTIRQNHQAAAQVATIVSKAENNPETPSEDGPPSEAPVTAAAVANHKVSNPMEPRTITIKKINVYARIISVGILKSGAMATPRNSNDTGWYNGSARPGEGGAIVIVGHVSGAVKAGVFYDLKKLDKGDVISVERGDGTVFDYRVVAKEQVPSGDVDPAKLLLPVTVGKGGLNIMTCGGKYMADKETFTDRVIVYTEQV